MNNKNNYDEKWFAKRALESLRKIDGTIWDYSDSLLLYSSQGQEAYSVAHDENSPYFQLVTKPEHLFLRSVAENVSKILPSSFEYYDLGVGVENKEQYFFDAFKNKIFKYLPVDVSEYFLSIAQDIAKKKGVNIKPLQTSFEELPFKIEDDRSRFITLLGLTFSNYLPADIMGLLNNIAGKNGYIFFDVQLRERIEMKKLVEIYDEYVAPACVQKIKLLGLDVSNDVTKFAANDEISISCTLLNVNENLQKRELKLVIV